MTNEKTEPRPTGVPLFTFKVDGQDHFLHGTLDACLDLMRRWGPGHYEIIPYEPEKPSLDSRLRALASDWEANGNSRELGDPTDTFWFQCARELLTILDEESR